jgi:SAM-dependent methyltransferase
VNPYRLLYRLGITPWERSSVPKPVSELAERLSTPGKALDVGCGTGRDAVFLSGRGWAVTGVDAVAQAIEGARERASAAGVEVRWVLGDVTRLETLGLGEGYDLVLDRGCFHGLTEEERARTAAGVSALTAPGARLLLFAFQPRRLGLGPSGLTADQLEGHFAGWSIVSSTPEVEAKPPWWIGDVKPQWYELERSA